MATTEIDELGHRLPATNAVLILAFNRPKQTQRLLETVLEVYNPPRLYVSIDGPRSGNDGDRAAVRSIIESVEKLSRRGDLQLLTHTQNLGCANAVPSGINWFFRREKQGIILEDDIEVSREFFKYADWCLERFASDERILHVSGFQLLKEQELRGVSEILINSHASVWGWATWRRAWRLFDPKSVCASRREIMSWTRHLVRDPRAVWFYWLVARVTAQGKISSWAYRWILSIARVNGRCVVPRRSLVRNRGFGEGSTHTSRASNFESVKIGELNWDVEPLVGEMDDRDAELLHLRTNGVESMGKLARMSAANFLPASLFSWLVARRR